MMPSRFSVRPPRAAGIALPVVLVILALMLIGGVYLLKSVHSTGLTTGNLAYDATLGREADLGLHEGFQWLSARAASNRLALNDDDAANGYAASLAGDVTPRDDAFWKVGKTIENADGSRIEYVIHRLCKFAKSYDAQENACVQTSANTAALGNTTPLGASLASDASQYAGAPRIHYVITSRIVGGRGASVTNQMVVLIGA
ncbi:pilus assembly PilX family protein [Massilia sp. TN1-12]|uniref:pilus assembly PilX family protein n=1 Tax=Massilia paldalensis TaxID=3377675 RepID=UPI00384C44F3